MEVGEAAPKLQQESIKQPKLQPVVLMGANRDDRPVAGTRHFEISNAHAYVTFDAVRVWVRGRWANLRVMVMARRSLSVTVGAAPE